MTAPGRGGLGAAATAAALVLAADQASKWWGKAQFGLANAAHWTTLPTPAPIRINDYLDLVVVWNRGVSFGLLAHDSPITQWALIAFAIGAAAWLLWWAQRVRRPFLTLGAGLVAGGALGNAWDRWAHGAVFDFLDFHVGGFHWYAFNVADAAITFGAAALLLHFFFEPEESRPKKAP